MASTRKATNRRSPFIVGVLLSVMCVLGLSLRIGAAMVDTGRPGGDVGGDRFYEQVRGSLTPLLASAGQLVTFLDEVTSGATPAPASITLAADWAGEFATAAHRVSRLAIPAGGTQPHGRQASELFEHAARLYRESALAVPRLVAATGNAAARVDALHRVHRLQLLGDHLLDSGRRLVERPDTRGVTVEGIQTRPAVPDFVASGLAGGGPVAGPRDTPVLGAIVEFSAGEWLNRHRNDLAEALTALTTSSASTVEAVVARLGHDVPTGRSAEGAHNLRLALLISAEALRTIGPAGDDTDQAHRLWRTAGRVWTVATRLLAPGADGVSGALPALPTEAQPW